MSTGRSFSAFPDGWPGNGLLLLRLTLGIPLLYAGAVAVAASHRTAIPELAAAFLAIFLISGFFTSSSAAAIALTQVWMAFAPAYANDGARSVRLLLAAAAASLAMLGPGAWSLDALRFGRKVFEVGEPRSPRG
jgi:uncharacterized membrane protein YphA (DoxX/SURF4 family)